MDWLSNLFRVVIAVPGLAMLFFSISSIYEKEKRAAVISLFISCIVFGLLLLSFLLPTGILVVLNVGFLVILICVPILFFYPFSNR